MCVGPRPKTRAIQHNTVTQFIQLDVAFSSAEHPVVFDPERGIAMFTRTGEPHQPVYFQAALEPLLQRAELEARELGHNYVGSEHLVLAIVGTADPSLSALVKQHGVHYEAVKEAILRILNG